MTTEYTDEGMLASHSGPSTREQKQIRLVPVRENDRWTYRAHEQILPAQERCWTCTPT